MAVMDVSRIEMCDTGLPRQVPHGFYRRGICDVLYCVCVHLLHLQPATLEMMVISISCNTAESQHMDVDNDGKHRIGHVTDAALKLPSLHAQECSESACHLSDINKTSCIPSC